MEVKRKVWKCRKCGYIWINRKATKPLTCPKCTTYLWDREPIDKEGSNECKT